jgi:predicted nuclease of restriction endonuclease-like (RecB) superfamily
VEWEERKKERTNMEEKKDIIKVENTEVVTSNTDLLNLADKISQEVVRKRRSMAININATIVETYWNVGRYIVEFEQKGNTKAKYGASLLTNLSKILRAKVGRGYSRPNLNNMRKFYLMYPICQTSEKSLVPPICQTLSDKLTWSHICELITIDDPLEREFYEKECISGNWDVRTLHRQMESGLFMRLAQSKDKEGVLQLAHVGQQIQTAEDVVKDTYTLEFLGIEDKKQYKESDLEQKLIDNMQTFLLELGKGFAYIGRQYPLTINNVHYHIDLVFYHRILKCFVLIDLKKGAVKHKDIGQMNMYIGYFAKEENVEGDNPPIGIILGHYKDELMVEYATYGMDTNLFVSKYELYLPDKEELRRLVANILK